MEKKTYDLSLGDWGPYNKEYLGASFVTDKNYGETFNVEVFPGFFRRNIIASKGISGGPVKVWNANPDLTKFTYRYELEWKDKVYCDVTYNVTNDKRLDIECEFVNDTKINQAVYADIAFSYQVQKVKNGVAPLYQKTYAKPILNSNQIFIDAINYTDVKISERYARLGTYLGEEIIDFTTGVQGTALSGKYFYNDTHYAVYEADITANSLGVRYKAKTGGSLLVTINDTENLVLPLEAVDNFTYSTISFSSKKVNKIKIIPTVAVTIDGFVLGENVGSVEFSLYKRNVTPEKTVSGNAFTLKYENLDYPFIIKSDTEIELVRRILCNDIGPAIEHRVHDHVFDFFDAGGQDVYEVAVLKPFYLKAGERKTANITVFNGDETVEKITKPSFSLNGNNFGEKFAFSQNIMATTALINTVYPIYNRRGFIKHNTPGRFWDCLYSWDSGMIGVGLSTIDFKRAYECLYTYLTPVGDKHSPYIFAGSVVPTQIFLYKKLFDSYPENRDKLKEIYPMIKSYYNFFANMDKDVCQVNSGLIKTWHLFYNSGGWDDYPPQKELRKRTVEEKESETYNDTTPVITTAITVLISKILKNISIYFNIGDELDYDTAIEKYSTAIEKYLWDENSGYYSYAVHNEKGEFERFLLASDGSNFNMGLDGVYPYIAGVSSAERSKRVKENIINGLLTEVGVSAVDTRASYFSKTGYWNGSVWIPHEWILFTSLLDKGEVGLAKKIADIALEVWRRETNETYNSFEHFMIEGGRGAGYPQFSGLSTPILAFYESFYVKNAVTVGFSTVVTEKTVLDNEIYFKTYSATSGGVALVVLDGNYVFTVNGKTVTAKKLNGGCYAIKLLKGETIIKGKKL